MNDTPWMTPFLAKHKRSPTARQDGIAAWLKNEIDYLEGIERTEHGNGALSAYRATLKEITPTETTADDGCVSVLRWSSHRTQSGVQKVMSDSKTTVDIQQIGRDAYTEGYNAGCRAGMERSARIIETGSFFHDASQAARFAKEAAAAIRREAEIGKR